MNEEGKENNEESKPKPQADNPWANARLTPKDDDERGRDDRPEREERPRRDFHRERDERPPRRDHSRERDDRPRGGSSWERNDRPRGGGFRRERDDRPDYRRDDRSDRRDRPSHDRGPAREPSRTDKFEDMFVPVCGLAAVSKVFEKRPKLVERLFFDEPTGRKVGEFASLMAKAKKPYRQVEPDELKRISGSQNPGGIVALTKRGVLESATEGVIDYWAKEQEPVVILTEIGNSQNFGAVIRTATFFGVEKAIVGGPPKLTTPKEAAYRVANGGMECIDLRRAGNLPPVLKQLQKSHFVLGVSLNARQGISATEIQFPEDKPVALVFPGEGETLAEEILSSCAQCISLGGEGEISSLNLSAAAAILMNAFFAREDEE